MPSYEEWLRKQREKEQLLRDAEEIAHRNSASLPAKERKYDEAFAKRPTDDPC